MTRPRVAVLAVVFTVACAGGAVAGGAIEASDRPPASPAPALGAPLPGSLRIEGFARDPIGRPPARLAAGRFRTGAPPWALLVWRARDGLVCHEPGQVIDRRRLRTYAATYTGRVPRHIDEGIEVGSLRPDRKFGIGRQYFHFGRFLPYPTGEGGSCGDPEGPAGLVFSRATLFSRPDLGPARTIVEGIAGRNVRRVAVWRRGVRRRLALSRGGAFIAVFRGALSPGELPLEVTYAGGGVRRFDGG